VSLRATFFLLLLANLIFLAWANLVDVSPELPRPDSVNRLPRLKLASEAVSAPAPGSPDPGPRGAPQGPADVPTGDAGAQGPAAGDATTSTAGSVTVSNTVAASSSASSSPSTAGNAAPARRCVTVGPFNDGPRAARALELLQSRGFHPHERSDEAAVAKGYWVFVGGLKSASEETQVLRRLQTSGLADAQAMPDSDQGRRVSVGLFSERAGAERRARAVRNLGLDAEIEPRRTADAPRWVDVDLTASLETLPTEALLSLQRPGERLEVKACPTLDRRLTAAEQVARPPDVSR